MATKKKVNPFLEQQKRLQEQQDLVEKAKPQPVKTVRNKKVSMNIAIPQESKDKILRYASKKNLSASVIIQLWIDEHCVD